MKLKFYALGAVIFLILTTLTACRDLVEIENRDYVINMGVDKENDEYLVTYGMAWEDDEEKEGSVKTVRGGNFSFLIENTDISSEKKIFLGHVKTIILGEDILKDKKNLGEVVRVLKNDRELSSKTLVTECENKAGDAVRAVSEERQMYIWNFYRTNAGEAGHIQKTTFEDLKVQLERDGSAIIPRIKVEDGEIFFEGCGIISQGTLQKNFDQKQSALIYILNGDGEGALFENENYVMKITKNRRKVNFKDGICRIRFKTKGEIIYSENNVDSEEIETFLSKELTDFMKNEILHLPAGDYFDIGKYLIKTKEGNINDIRYEDYDIRLKIEFTPNR